MRKQSLSTFNQWLDGLVGGRSTPPRSSSSESDLRDVQSSASQLHDLIRTTDRTPPNRSLPPTWEEFMHTHQLEQTPRVTRTNHTPQHSTGAIGRTLGGPMDVLRSRPARYASNAFVAFVVMAVLLAGGWRAIQLNSAGPPENLPNVPFGAFVQDEATPDTDLLAPATADQCTTSPLSIDEVVAIVRNPYGTTATPPSADVSVPYRVATPEIDTEAVRGDEYATDEALAGATATFHMLEACVAANSYFQVWATFTPTLVQSSILHVLPPLTGETELRALLSDLEQNGVGDPSDPDFVFWPLGSGPGVATFESPSDIVRVTRTVDQNLENTWMPEPHFLVTGYTSQYPDFVEEGMPVQSIYDSNYDGTPEPLIGYDPRVKQPDCFKIIFMWSDSRDMWLIQNLPVCG